MLKSSAIVGWMIVLAALVQPGLADDQPLATGQLQVLGASLEVAPAQMTVPVGVPPQVQTVFCNGQVKPSPGAEYCADHLVLDLTVRGKARLFTTGKVVVSGTLTVTAGSAVKTAEFEQ